MKYSLWILLFLSLPLHGQVPKLDFNVDSTRMPIFCFSVNPQPENSYRWGFYHAKDIRIKKLRFETSKVIKNDWNNDTLVCEDFRDSLGVYWVCLERTATTGLKDTVCKRIHHYYDRRPAPRIPTFSPGSKDSGISKVFDLKIEGESLYDLVIYNRWGTKVFQSKNKDDDWNGKMFNTGEPCPDGTYYYILNYRFIGKDENEPVINGTIRMMR